MPSLKGSASPDTAPVPRRPTGSSSHLPSRPGPSLGPLLTSKSFLRRARKAAREHSQPRHQLHGPASRAQPQPRARLSHLRTRHRWRQAGRTSGQLGVLFQRLRFAVAFFLAHPRQTGQTPSVSELWEVQTAQRPSSEEKRFPQMPPPLSWWGWGGPSQTLSLSVRRGCQPSQWLRPLRNYFPSTIFCPESESLELAPKEKAKVRKFRKIRKITLEEREALHALLRAQ